MKITDLNNKEAIDKIKELAEAIDICLFCTNLKENDGLTTRPMGTQGVDLEGNIWFFSDKNSTKNKEIEADNKVQLFYSHPVKSSYMVLNGEAEIILDQMQEGISPVDIKKTLRISDRKEAIRTAIAFSTEGDIILIAGKGHEKYQEVNGVKYPFDDFEIVKENFKTIDI